MPKLQKPKDQRSYTAGERAIARSLVISDGIKVALRAKILLRVKARGTSDRVRITSKLRSTNQDRKNRIQENTISDLEKLRAAERFTLQNEWFIMNSAGKKKFKTLRNFIDCKATL